MTRTPETITPCVVREGGGRDESVTSTRNGLCTIDFVDHVGVTGEAIHGEGVASGIIGRDVDSEITAGFGSTGGGEDWDG